MPKQKQNNGNETDRNICKLVVQHLRREIRKERRNRPESFRTSKRVYHKRDPLDPSLLAHLHNKNIKCMYMNGCAT